MSAVNGPMQYVGPISERKCIGDWLQKNGQFLYWKKEAAEKNHGETEEVGKGLGFENLAHCHGDEKAQKGGGHGNEKNSRNKGPPSHL